MQQPCSHLPVRFVWQALANRGGFRSNTDIEAFEDIWELCMPKLTLIRGPVLMDKINIGPYRKTFGHPLAI